LDATSDRAPAKIPSNLTADEIVRLAMSDRAVYDAMASREAEVWGRVLPAREQNPAVAVDQQAARDLRLNRDQLALMTWARGSGRTFERCLSLGCGEGRFERQLIAGRICRRAHGVDVAASAVNEARAKAAAEKYDITYEQADINFFTAEPGAFDLVVAQTSLHHILYLEHVLEQAWRALKPGGIFWVHDYIGESQFQYADDRMEIVNAIIERLPEKFRLNRINGQLMKPVVRKAPGTLVSPFESIRSADIPKLLPRWFDVIEKREITTLLHLVVPVGTRSAYVENEDTRALFEILYLLDNICLKHGILAPVGGLYVLTPKAEPPPAPER
jgi:2-polyprenyl-3-methyl-5-hydroxy-6-metoxy-1,4-benzoquinol methylase